MSPSPGLNVGVRGLLTSAQLQGCAVVLTSYGPSHRLKGVLGVIGPTRMAYSQTVARLRAVAERLGVRRLPNVVGRPAS